MLDCYTAQDVFSTAGVLLVRKNTLIVSRHIRLFRRHGIKSIPVLQTAPVPQQVQRRLEKIDPSIGEKYEEQFERMTAVFTADQLTRRQKLQDALDYFDTLLEPIRTSRSIFRTMQQLKGHDQYTYRHSINVGILCALIAEVNGLSDERVLEAGRAGLIHDIGKLFISEDIIRKPERLSEEEFREVKKHPIHGADMLQEYETIPYLHSAVLSHHERLDGSGYPEGAAGEQLSEAARITAIADVYDAVTSDRSYHQGATPFTGMKILEEEMYKGKLCSILGIPFLHYMIRTYTGTQVLLSDGRIGHVVQIPQAHIDQPLIFTSNQVINLYEEDDLFIEDLYDERMTLSSDDEAEGER